MTMMLYILILTTALCSVQATDNCYNAGKNDYVGKLPFVLIDGLNRSCYAWEYFAALRYDFVKNENFPDGSISAAGNNCRNPNNRERPWCYYWPQGSDYLWGYCDIPNCDGGGDDSGGDVAPPTKAPPPEEPSHCQNGNKGLGITLKNLKGAVNGLGYYPKNEPYLLAMKNMLNCNFTEMNHALVAAAQFAHESGGFIHCNEISPGWDYNSGTNGGIPGKSYHGRGPIQLSWDYNYRDASKAIFGDSSVLLQNPDLVCEELWVAAATALWYWNTRVATRPGVPEYFGESTKAINGGLEDGTCWGHRAQSDRRYKFYLEFIKQIPVAKPSNKCAMDGVHYCSKC